ncbi:putative late blight resistance protein homolog R1A-3 [Primulina huaijiensis]|uniref:putative late blight resistance protein homolog R1A-3 n=1 Tax=Primulina huaijiensis TaxID=1492673 RepID=UPI003CC6F9DF
MAAVYAALLSLARSLRQILDLEKYIDPLHKERIVSLHENVSFIINFLEDYSDKCCDGTLDLVGNGIRKASFEAQDFMDSYMCSIPKNKSRSSSSEANCDKVMNLDRDLNMALERINFILEESIKMNNGTAEDVRSRTYSSRVDHPSTLKTTARNIIVGLDDDLNKIKERLYESSSTLRIIPIVGMGGIGKTTLARRAYEGLLRTQHFDICSWITVSAEYKRREMLSVLLQKSEKELSDQSDEKLKTLVYQHLMGRRYLVVIDDIWSTKVWDDLRVIFPDDGSGSRILLTTRLSDVAIYAGCSSDLLHQMDFLNKDQSWKLLQEMIFGQESCPLHLEEIGKKIALNCGGLPLTIVLVAGLISIGNTREEVREKISKNISSMEPTIELQCSKVICLSYDRLPLWLKPCFLYITAFPEDSEVYVSKLINLWVAEGFLKPSDHEFSYLEDVGERYLEDLVNKNLILVNKKGRDGKPETVGMHDLLREICITKAEEEGFFHYISSKKNAWNDVAHNPNRRISINCTQDFHEWRIQDSSTRSVLLFSKRNSESRLYLSCRQLSILDASNITWPNFSDVISTFINLRYIAFALNDISCPHGFPASISRLPYLETIIAFVSSLGRLQVPYEIWEMPKLRHLFMNERFHLSYPSDIEIVHKTGIQTLGTVINFRFTEEVIEKLVNLKSLQVFFAVYDGRWDYLNLNNLFRLQNLEVLRVTMQSVPYLRIWSYAFPISLKQLSLRLVNFPWENMAIIGSLPNLQMLEMMGILVTEDSEWTPMEGQFLRLKHFQSTFDYLVKWEVEKEHFPCLESLIFCNVRWIDEIPSGIGEIDSLQLIELRYCRESLVNSAKKIQEQQLENGNDSFEVLVIR